MKKGKYESPPRHSRRGGKVTALVLALGLLIGCAVGGTLAWLLDKSNTVTNTFTASDINITLTETGTTNNQKEFKMIPGHVNDKDPKVTVKADSEACWLFVKVDESTDEALADYIVYAVDEGWTAGKGTCDCQGDTCNVEGHGIPTNVYYREVTAATSDQDFTVLGDGSYTFNNGTDDTADDVTVTWQNNQVAVKPEVTKEMMNTLTQENYPTLTFTAYATQYWKDNTNPFTAADAWAQAQTLG